MDYSILSKNAIGVPKYAKWIRGVSKYAIAVSKYAKSFGKSFSGAVIWRIICNFEPDFGLS
ncbi:MAG: hypothetical protein IJP74_07630 [Prevotella sp.]|nr:hypothetical protein [Prevotella sp.]